MSKWLLSIIGVVFLGVLFDLLYPEGRVNKLCKSIFGIFATFVMISPLFDFDINKIFVDVKENTLLIDSINNAKEDTYKKKIIKHLQDCGICGVSVEIKSNLDYNDFVIENVYVDSTNLVLTENVTNINKYEVIAKEISGVINIPIERVVVYG